MGRVYCVDLLFVRPCENWNETKLLNTTSVPTVTPAKRSEKIPSFILVILLFNSGVCLEVEEAHSNPEIWLATFEASPKAKITGWLWSS